MKIYLYLGLNDEKVPKDVTHVIVDSSVTAIKECAFYGCIHLVSVIMGDNVKRIKEMAFWCCHALRFVRLSKTLEYIGEGAFCSCDSMEALFLPSTLKSIEGWAFYCCESLRLMILPNGIDLSNVGAVIIRSTNIEQFAVNMAEEYEWDDDGAATDESVRRVNEWLIHYMDEAPFHKICYNPSITTKQINDYLLEHGTDAVLAIDPYHVMTPLHMLSINPNAPANAIAALLDVDVEVAFRLDNQGKVSLDYARDYNVGGLIAMLNGLCNHRHSA